MSLTVKDFLRRAEQGRGSIRLSEKSQPGGELRLSSRKSGFMGNRFVEWIRDVTGQNATAPFLRTIEKEYGSLAALEVGKRLRVNEGRPLTSCDVVRMVNVARQGILSQFAPTAYDGGDTASGYASAVESARAETGVDDASDLLNETTGREVRRAIRKEIEKAADKGETIVGEDAARTIARQKASEYLRGSEPVNQVIEQLPSTAHASDFMKAVKLFTVQRVCDPQMSDQQILRDMDNHVRALKSDELLEAYRTMHSPDVLELRLALHTQLQAKLQENPDAPEARTMDLLLTQLGNYEAAVRSEMIERTGTQPASRLDEDGSEFADRGPTPGQLAALAGAERRAAKRELDNQADSYLRGEDSPRTAPRGATEKLRETGLAPEEFARELRAAELTVNAPARLFVEGGPLLKDPRLKNAYALPNVKGPEYGERRDIIDDALESVTKRFDKDGVDPENHPISAGINVGRKIAGAAPAYGEVVLVLKDELKNRSTYTAMDSFNVFEASVTDDKIAAYKAKVKEMLEQSGDDLPKGHREAFAALAADTDAVTAIYEQLDLMIGQYGANRPFLDAFAQGPMRKVGPPGNPARYLLTNAAIKIFATPDSAYVTTRRQIGELAESLSPEVLNAVIAASRNPELINLPVDRYMEAQVYGGIDLRNDVAEIRYIKKDPDTMTPEQKRGYVDFLAGLRQFRKRFGVRVVSYTPQDATAHAV